MGKKQAIERYLVLFLPWGIATLFQSDPVLSYFIAWLGNNIDFLPEPKRLGKTTA